jgi:hypothetical protein
MKLALLGPLLACLAGPALAAPAIPSDQFFESIGVVIQPGFVAEAEWNNDQWPGFLSELGVKNVRGKLSTNTTALKRLQPFFSSGGKMVFTVVAQDGGIDKTKTKKNIEFIAANVNPANIAGLESANELNHTLSATETARALKDIQPYIRQVTSGLPRLAGVPLVAPSIYVRDPAAYGAVGSLEPNVDRWNLHYYNEGRRPPVTGGLTKPGTLSQAILDARTLAPTKGGYITEMGYKYATPDASPAAGVLSDKAAAKYILRAYFDYFAAGAEKSFLYSLIDDAARGSINHGLRMTAAQGFKPRQSFYAVKNLTTLFKGSGGFGSLDYSLSGHTSATRQHLFSKGDGSFLLVLYQDVDSWDRSNKRDLNPAPVSVTVNFPTTIGRAEVLEPTFDLTPKQSVAVVDKIVVPVADHAVVVRIWR